MKIGLFTDLHYTKHPEEGRKFTALAPARVKEAMEAFRKEKVDVAVCLGDIVDKAKTHEEELSCWKELLTIIKEYPFPCYFVPGNHDYEVMIGDEFCQTTGMPKYPFSVDVAGRRLLFLDACYRLNEKRYDEAGMVWTETMLPNDQVEFLKKNLIDSPL
ncbi:MAG: metallophosphoesterase, partial [Clostridia bacterium]|nr:metallophosphoesterase [Clostridia bacterium]